LQSTTNLTPVNWQNEGPPFPGTGTLAVTNIAFSAAPQKFFRLLSGN
jgi:hypothetical protein